MRSDIQEFGRMQNRTTCGLFKHLSPMRVEDRQAKAAPVSQALILSTQILQIWYFLLIYEVVQVILNLTACYPMIILHSGSGTVHDL